MNRVPRRVGLRLPVLVVAALLVLPFAAGAANFYVSPTGSDLNAGTLAKPFQTLANSLTHLAPGDKLVLLAGTFNEQLNLTPLGTPASPITIIAKTRGTAIIQTTYDGAGITATAPIGNLVLDGLVVNGTGYGILLSSAAKLTIRNCEIRNGYQGVRITDGSNVVLQNCDVHDNRFGYLLGYLGVTGIKGLSVQHCRATNNSYEGLTGNTDGFLVDTNCTGVSLQDCVASGHGDAGYDIKAPGARLERCQSYSNGVSGFKLWTQNDLLANCVAYDNGFSGLIAAGNGLRVWNCTFAANSGWSMQLESPDPATVLVRNTVFADTAVNIMPTKMYNDNCNLYYAAPNTPMIWVGPTAWRIGRLASGKKPLGARSLVSDPGFLSPSTFDYNLQATSPARGKGVWNDLCALDVLERPRVASALPDLGAFKYIGETPPPPATPLMLQAAAAPTPSGAVQLQLSSTREAMVEVNIRNLAGQAIACLPATGVKAGVTTLLWGGRSTRGTEAPAGAYLAEVRAKTATGQTACLLVRLQK